MKEVCDAIDRLIAYARAKLGLSARNETYVRNTVLDLVGLESYEGAGQAYDGRSVSVLLRELVDACARAGLPAAERAERLTDSVMGALMLPPESVEEAFAAHMAVSSEEATEWLYSYSVLSDYVKKEKLDANPRFSGERSDRHHQQGKARVPRSQKSGQRQQREGGLSQMHHLPRERGVFRTQQADAAYRDA